MICPAKTSTSILTGASVARRSHCRRFVLWVGLTDFVQCKRLPLHQGTPLKLQSFHPVRICTALELSTLALPSFGELRSADYLELIQHNQKNINPSFGQGYTWMDS